MTTNSSDHLNNLGRAMLTGGDTINRSAHALEDIKTKKLRILTPVETEGLKQFPNNRINSSIASKIYFMMGNALVCGIIKELGLTS